MLTHALDMILQVAFLLLGRLGIHVFLVGHERHLRIDDGILSLRIVEDHVGLHLLARLVILQRAPHLVAQPCLHLIVDTLRESLTGQQVTEDDLTHVAAHLIVATQHVSQSLRLLTKLLGLLHHLQHLFTERSRVGRTLLLGLIDSLLHVGDGILQGLGDTRHRLRVLLLQFRGTGLHQLLRHVLQLLAGRTELLLELLVAPFQFLSHLLAHQFEFPALRLRLGMERLVLRFQMVHATGGGIQLFSLHREFDILLSPGDAERVHPTVHQQVEHHGAHHYTDQNI